LRAAEVERFADCIAGGGVALFGADTVYGLACDPSQARAVRRLYELKGRPPTQPAAVMFFALAPALAALPELGPRTRTALQELLPGPLTVLLANPAEHFPLAGAPATVLAVEGPPESETVPPALGLRVPLLAAPLATLETMQLPVLQSSANLSGGPEARHLQDVAAPIRAGVDVALDVGELPGVASTVLDLSSYELDGRWRIVREGPASAAELSTVLAG
jgi:L-threonylcarbamoyladenylate synthase